MKVFISFALVLGILSAIVTLTKLIVAAFGVAIGILCLLALLGLATS